MEEQLLRLNAEAASLDTEIKAAVAKMEAATSDGDRAMHTKIYDNLVTMAREVNAMRASLTTQLAGRLVPESCRLSRSEAEGMHCYSGCANTLRSTMRNTDRQEDGLTVMAEGVRGERPGTGKHPPTYLHACLACCSP